MRCKHCGRVDHPTKECRSDPDNERNRLVGIVESALKDEFPNLSARFPRKLARIAVDAMMDAGVLSEPVA